MKMIDYQTGAYDPTVEAYSVQVLQADGIYDVRKCGVATMIFKVCDYAFASLPTVLKEGIILNVPKMPGKIFTDLLAFYRHIYSLYKSEVYVAVFYDTEKKEFFFYVPKQIVHGALAKISEESGQALNNMREKYILVLETHSHNIMTGHFSGIDDRDQTVPDVIHLVIGNIERESPSYQIRIALGNKKVDLKYTDVFEADNYMLDLAAFPNWKENIMQPAPLFNNPSWERNGFACDRNRFPQEPTRIGSINAFDDELSFPEFCEEYPEQTFGAKTQYYEHKLSKNYIRA